MTNVKDKFCIFEAFQQMHFCHPAEYIHYGFFYGGKGANVSFKIMCERKVTVI